MSRFYISLCLMIMPLHANEPTQAELLREGLFEEEANRNLELAAEKYRAIIERAKETDRALAASATFRLGEIARKKNDTAAATIAFRTVAEKFPEQTELVRLSFQNLMVLGLEQSAAVAADIQKKAIGVMEMDELKELASKSPQLFQAADSDGVFPIHHAAAQGNVKVMEFLIENGADPNSKNNDGLTALDYVVQSSSENGKEAINALIKHGATVDDPHKLLSRTSDAMLTHVLDNLVYPKVHKPTEIYLSVSGEHPFPFEQISEYTGASKSPRVLTLEKRFSENSAPPTFAEALSIGFHLRSIIIESIRIKRRTVDNKYETIDEWNAADLKDSAPPIDFPELKWGDILEVRTSWNNEGRRDNNQIVTIPSRTVTIRMGELEYPFTISGSGKYWLSGPEPLGLISPYIHELIFIDRCVILRKGLTEPFRYMAPNQPLTVIRLLDGDVIELELDPEKMLREQDEKFSNEITLMDNYDKDSGWKVGTPKDKEKGLIHRVMNSSDIDISRIVIFRRASKFKMELINMKAWLDQLPPREEWTKGTFVSMPKIGQGDYVVFMRAPEMPDDVLKPLHAKLNAIEEFLLKP